MYRVIGGAHTLEMIEDLGPNLGKPHTASMGDGLFEIRAKGKEGIGRSFFAIVVDNEIVILHSFIKKSQKVPKKELKRAKEYLQQFKQMEGE